MGQFYTTGSIKWDTFTQLNQLSGTVLHNWTNGYHSKWDTFTQLMQDKIIINSSCHIHL